MLFSTLFLYFGFLDYYAHISHGLLYLNNKTEYRREYGSELKTMQGNTKVL